MATRPTDQEWRCVVSYTSYVRATRSPSRREKARKAPAPSLGVDRQGRSRRVIAWRHHGEIQTPNSQGA